MLRVALLTKSSTTPTAVCCTTTLATEFKPWLNCKVDLLSLPATSSCSKTAFEDEDSPDVLQKAILTYPRNPIMTISVRELETLCTLSYMF
ncbi:exported hypothetical protein [Kamptonema sp. PCC 6506]|nr:exported hypothetical protein [Kamptonema sp. PCC 6506]